MTRRRPIKGGGLLGRRHVVSSIFDLGIWGHLLITPEWETTTEPHSYLSDGRLCVWTPPQRFCLSSELAVDAELVSEPPFVVADALGVHGTEFWVRWTRLEVYAKLLDVPVMSLIREAGEVTFPWRTWVRTRMLPGDICVSVGVRDGHGTQSGSSSRVWSASSESCP